MNHPSPLACCANCGEPFEVDEDEETVLEADYCADCQPRHYGQPPDAGEEPEFTEIHYRNPIPKGSEGRAVEAMRAEDAERVRKGEIL